MKKTPLKSVTHAYIHSSASTDAEAISTDYQACLTLAKNHYENFPVAALWFPKNIRQAVAAIYAFARTADDFADEGDAPAETRLEQLEQYRQYLTCLEKGEAVDAPFFRALNDAMQQHALPLQPFYDLLSAFSQDVSIKRYDTFDEVQEYCRRSANPIGLLMLSLHGVATPDNVRDSNCICSALQWINFLQDIGQDYDEMQRIYIPQEDFERFKITEQHFQQRRSDDKMSALMLFQVKRVRQMLLQGLPLEKALKGRFKWMIMATLRCAVRILDKLEQSALKGQVFQRPRLSKAEVFRVFFTPYRRLEARKVGLASSV